MTVNVSTAHSIDDSSGDLVAKYQRDAMNEENVIKIGSASLRAASKVLKGHTLGDTCGIESKPHNPVLG